MTAVVAMDCLHFYSSLIMYCLSLIQGVWSQNCPSEYPFPVCPRPGLDDHDATQCCHHPNEGYACCIPPHPNQVGQILLYVWCAVMVVALTLMSVYCICYCFHKLYDLCTDHEHQDERLPLVDSGIYV
ncbi:uncharacterized protein LOC144434711 [Glandiceps talaboti]